MTINVTIDNIMFKFYHTFNDLAICTKDDDHIIEIIGISKKFSPLPKYYYANHHGLNGEAEGIIRIELLKWLRKHHFINKKNNIPNEFNKMLIAESL